MTSANGDRALGDALYGVKEHVDDLLGETLSASDRIGYDQTRQQWRALAQLTARTNNLNPSTGQVNPRALAAYLQQKDKSGFLYGRNTSDAYSALRFSQAFPPVVGNSGTATREALGWKDLVFGIPGRFISRSYLGGPSAGPVSGVVGPMVRGVARLPSLAGSGLNAVSEAGAPYAAAGLPGLNGALVPYLTQ